MAHSSVVGARSLRLAQRNTQRIDAVLHQTLAAVDTLAGRVDATNVDTLARAVAVLAGAVSALAQRSEAQSRLLAKIEAHMATGENWTASAIVAVQVANDLQQQQRDAQRAVEDKAARREERRVKRFVPVPSDTPVAGMLARLSSDLARAGDPGTPEYSRDDVAILLDNADGFDALRARLPRHAAHCAHTRLSDCPIALEWLTADNRFARVLGGEPVEAILLAYDQVPATTT